jgi:glycine hydroxymethyltransferase
LILAPEKYHKIMNSQIFPGIQGGPMMHTIAAKAVAFKEALTPEFRRYQKQVVANARKLAGALKSHGFQLVSGGTDNHILLVDLTSKNVTGLEAETALDAAGITVNKNSIPFETRSPQITSGIRIGTPAVTTRGLQEEDMVRIAGFIDRALEEPDNGKRLKIIRAEVRDFCRGFPLFPSIGL